MNIPVTSWVSKDLVHRDQELIMNKITNCIQVHGVDFGEDIIPYLCWRCSFHKNHRRWAIGTHCTFSALKVTNNSNTAYKIHFFCVRKIDYYDVNRYIRTSGRIDEIMHRRRRKVSNNC